MTFLLYQLKFSIALTLVFIFYHFVLRKLTFYNLNRWYLLGYSLLALIAPLLDISHLLKEKQLLDNGLLQLIPAVTQPVIINNTDSTHGSIFIISNILTIILLSGIAVMLARFLIQLFSFRRLMKRARVIQEQDMNVYEVATDIIPFSFGKNIFINSGSYSESELTDIIRHEFVHVKQKHSFDIFWGEMICLLNWYNPFAWLFKKAIRQNLEFIADHEVLRSGINKKQYQYLLLKVLGSRQFRFATQFNFSSLKVRIAMMNRIRSARIHLLRFFLIVPLLLVMLVLFRNQAKSSWVGKRHISSSYPVIITDTIHPPVKKIHNTIKHKEKNNLSDTHVGEKKKESQDTASSKEYSYKLYPDYGARPAAPPAPTAMSAAETEAYSSERRPLHNTLRKDDMIVFTPGNLVWVFTVGGNELVYNLNKENDRKTFTEKYGKKVSIEKYRMP
jgi:beta-lactamase regulating signal transducer with metallopeptidase domain